MTDPIQKIVERAEKEGNQVYSRVLEAAFEDNAMLKEELSQVNAMFAKEDIGWGRFGQGNDLDQGLELLELHRWAWQIREAMAGNPHIKRGWRLRASYVWRDGIQYENIPGAKQGKGTNVQARIDQPINQRNFFGHSAREEREGALYSDSAVYYLGDSRDYSLQPVPIWQIYGYYTNPDNHAEVWAYRRVWEHWEQGVGATPMNMWYLTDRYPQNGPRPTAINLGGVEYPVDPNIIMFEGHVNGQIGWAHGIPDALAALIWARLYRDFLTNGKIMSDAMAQFAFQATVQSKKGADNVALALAQPRQAGGVAVGGVPNQLVPMSTAGKGYDFASGNELAAVIATALEVSTIHLTSNPGSAGASYGSAQTLDMPTKLAIESRRQWHIEFDKRVLAWMGAKDAIVTFGSQDDLTDIFREVQALLLMWSSGLYAAAPLEARLSQLMTVVGNVIPSGVIVPNNSDAKYLVTPDRTANPNAGVLPANDPTATAAAKATDKAAATAANKGGVSNPNGTSPQQGKSSGVGKGTNANDLRTDKIANMLQQLNDFIASEKALVQD